MVAKAAKLIDRVPTDDEDKFRAKMRKEGNAIGTAPSQIREALARVKKADPGIDDEQAAAEAAAGDGPGQTLRASFTAGTRMDNLCYYYMCLASPSSTAPPSETTAKAVSLYRKS